MGELEKEYAGRLAFDIRSAGTDEGRAAAKKYDFGTRRHGLVGLAADGTMKVKLAGHNYGRAEIVAKIEELLR